MTQPTLRAKLRYQFDNLMARGTAAQILLLAVLSGALIVVTALIVVVGGLDEPTDGGEPVSFGRRAWSGLMHALDAGTLGGDAGGWGYLIVMLGLTIGGIFILSTLIGVLNNGLGAFIDGLRKGKSQVMERDHTVILGYSPRIHTLLSELAEANANQTDSCVVVLADRDKVEMDDEIRQVLGKRKMRVVTRSGSPLQLADLALANLAESRSVVVLAPDSEEADTVVLRTLLALAKISSGTGRKLHVVSEVHDAKMLAIARIVSGDDAALVLAPPLISRLLVQTGRQSGLSVVYTALLDFGGAEIYMRDEPQLVGRSFRAVLVSYDDSSPMGVLTRDGQMMLPPPFERVMQPGDKVIAISEDDDTLVVNGRAEMLGDDAIVAAPRHSTRERERTLILGASPRLAMVLHELDSYVAAGSHTVVIGERIALPEPEEITGQIRNMEVDLRAGDITDRSILDSLAVGDFDHILVLSETANRNQEMADARTMITLLHLRDIARRTGRSVPITSEILDIQNRELASVAEADDFIISNTLVSLMVAQVSENRHLVGVFDELFSAGGHEIYLKPAEEFVKLGASVDFYAVVEAAARRGEVAIGYRSAARARDAEAGFGVMVNPVKHREVRFAPGDKVIVLADE